MVTKILWIILIVVVVTFVVLFISMIKDAEENDYFLSSGEEDREAERIKNK